MYSKPYSLPHGNNAMQAEVEKELDTMLKLGIIEPSVYVIDCGCSKTRWVKPPSLC